MKPLRLILVLSLAFVLGRTARADGFYWTNNGTANFTNVNDWFTGGALASSVPVITDNTYFTNNSSPTVNWTVSATNANAYFDTTSNGLVTLTIGAANTWWLTNSFVVGQNAGTTGRVTLSTGTLLVTNATGTGSLVVGQSGKGTFTLGGGTLTVDQLFVTNNLSGSYTNSVLTLNSGTLTTRASTINPLGASFNIGTGGLVWNMAGGTNLISKDSYIGSSANNNSVNVSGSGTVWTNVGDIRVGQGGNSNQLYITGGAKVYATAYGQVGGGSGASNTAVVSDSSSLWSVKDLYVGSAGVSNLLVITNGGVVTSVASTVMGSAGGSNNVVIITGQGSTLKVGSSLVLGNSANAGGQTLTVTTTGLLTSATSSVGNNATANNNTLTVSGSATWTNGGLLAVGAIAGASWNTVLVTDPGSTLTNMGSAITVGASTNTMGNRVIVSNGGSIFSKSATVGAGAGASNNTGTVTDPNSTWTVGYGNGDFTIGVGNAAVSNRFLVLNGGKFYDWNTNGGTVQIGGAGGSNNAMVVAGRGSVAQFTNAAMTIAGNGNQLVVTNGGSFYSPGMNLGLGGTNNLVLVSDSGSIFSNRTVNVGYTNGAQNQLILSNGAQAFLAGNGLLVGTNSAWLGNQVLISSGALLEQNTIVVGQTASSTVSGSVTNSGGIFQFTTNAPTIKANTSGVIVLTNGWISFRGITNADVMANQTESALTNITFQGNNIFRLNNASNFASASQSYTFATSSGSTNYVGLEMVNGGTAWKSAWLNIGSGGSMLVSNTTATVDGVLTNNGTITVAKSTVSYLSNVVLNGGGSYVSQSGTNTFNNISIASGASFLADALSRVTANGSYQNFGSSVFSNLLTVGSGGYYAGIGSTNQFAGMNVNAGAAFVLNNSPSTIFTGTVTNSGTMAVTNSVVSYLAPVVISGGYISDPSTNIYASTLTVGPTGYISAASGDLYLMGKDFVLQSSNNAAFNMIGATMMFTNLGNGTNHTINLTGSTAFDYGSNILNYTYMVSNFGLGTLSIALNNSLTLTGGVSSGGATNALYVGTLDIQAAEAFSTNQMTSLTNAIFAALSLPDINLYYDKNVGANSYLGGLEYNLWGGNGLLIPIPEPSPLALIVVVTALGGWIAARRRKS